MYCKNVANNYTRNILFYSNLNISLDTTQKNNNNTYHITCKYFNTVVHYVTALYASNAGVPICTLAPFYTQSIRLDS